MANKVLKLPATFMDLNSAEMTDRKLINIIGVIVDYMPPTPTRGEDFLMTITLQDHFRYISGQAKSGATIKLFLSQDRMPTVKALGDILLLRNVERIHWCGNYFIMKTKATETMCFPATQIVDPAYSAAIASGEKVLPHTAFPTKASLSISEQLYIINLRKWASGIDEFPSTSTKQMKAPPSLPTKGPSIGGSKKFSLLQDVQISTFVDLVGEVRKMWGTKNGTNLYLTDYTSNNLLYDYRPIDVQAPGQNGDEFGYISNMPVTGWSGPFGKMTIQVTLWYPHDAFANAEVHVGDIVLLRNVHITFKQLYIEGILHQDRFHPTQVDVRKLPSLDPRVQAVYERRDRYQANINGQAGDSKVKMSKAEKKKKRKLKQLANAAPDDLAVPDDEPAFGIHKRQKLESNIVGEPHVILTNKKTNPNVIAENEHLPCLTISEIWNTPHLTVRHELGHEVTLPFVNQVARTRVRVIDFVPSNLEDFTQPLEEDQNRWGWFFHLLIEDAKPDPDDPPVQLPLQVYGEHAVNLLKLDAVDLRANKDVLKQLREILFTLWGNLEELKSSGNYTLEALESADRFLWDTKLSNKAFECCVMEFGHQQDDDDDNEWLRKHAICKTVIA